MKKIVVFFSLFCCAFITFSQPAVRHVEGVIFLDKNKNGQFDKQENGWKGIPVSNGDTIVFSDSKGRFSLDVDSVSSVFPIIPSGYRMSGTVVQNANFFSAAGNSENNIAFGLESYKQKTAFRIGAIGDVQVSDEQEIAYANQTVMAELAARSDIDFNIFLGDLVNNNMEDLPLFRQMMETLPADSWAVAGNHDRDKVVTNQQSTFNGVFGAADYAFNYADVHFIVLNDVFGEGLRKYEGRFTDKQLRFVKNDLSLIPKNKLVVISLHIPMRMVKNKEAILNLLEGYKNVLVLSGHTHRVSRWLLAPNVMEIVAGASCGNWWTGERDWQGIPSALMQGGAPRNYFVIDFSKNDYRFQFKGIGLDDEKQMSVWIAGQDSLDKYVPFLQEQKANTILVNVYAGSERTEVRMQVDGGQWIAMSQVKEVAPDTERMIAMNRQKVYPTTFSRKAALRHSASSHLWKAYLPAGLSPGAHCVKIEAREGTRFQVQGTSLFIK